MALIFIDGFDYYTTLLDRWTTAGNSGGIPGSSGATVARNGNGLSVTNLNRSQTKTLPSSYSTLVIGTAFRINSAAGTTWNVFAFNEGGAEHVSIRLDFALNKFLATRNGTTIGTGTFVWATSTWYYVEMKATIHDTTGSLEFRVNGVADITLTNVDTRNAGTGVVNQIQLGAGGSGGSCAYDDMYVLDTSGGSPTDTFLGDVRVEALYPNGNGNSSQFDGSDGNSTDNYLLVDEAPPNGDTDYVESPDVGDKDTYAYTNLTPGTGTVYGVQILPYARKSDAGGRSIKSVARLSATEVDSSDDALSDSYLYFPDIREAKPGGGVWTVSDVNSAEFGVKVSA